MQFFDHSECTYASMRVHLAGARLGKLRGMKFGIKTDKSYVFTEGNDPVDIKSGNKEPGGELKMLKGALDDIVDAALAAGATDPTDIRIDVVVSFRKQGQRKLRMFRLESLEFTEFNYESMQGDKEMEVTLPFMFLKLVFL